MQNLKYKWKFEDLRQIGVFFKSFLKKGRIVDNSVLLPELDENISTIANSFYNTLLDALVFGYFSQTEGKTEKLIGKRQAWKKGETASLLLCKDLNDTYINEWGGDIDFESLTDLTGKKKRITAKKKEEARENTKEEKKKRLNYIFKNIINLIDEFNSINNEVGDNETKENFIRLIYNYAKEQNL